MTTEKKSGVSRRGFASLSPERRKEIAAKGGAAVPAEKRSFSKNRKLAREAGRKGGEVGGSYADKAKAKREAKSNG